MRIALAVLVLVVTLGPAGATGAADEKCMISDSALCLANPNCHWDGARRGCSPGPAPYVDPCSSHEGEEICASDNTLGCQWSAADSKCESKVKPNAAD
jgi:hypothetical protein